MVSFSHDCALPSERHTHSIMQDSRQDPEEFYVKQDRIGMERIYSDSFGLADIFALLRERIVWRGLQSVRAYSGCSIPTHLSGSR